MTALREALRSLDPAQIEQADQEREGTVERAELMLDYVEGLLEAADPRLVSRATLDAIHGPIDQALTAVNNLGSDPATHSNELDQAIENALAQTAALATAAVNFGDSAKKLGRKSGGFAVKMKRLDGDAEMIREELEELESRRKSGLEEVTAEQEEKRTELTTRLNEVQAAVDTERDRINALVTELEERFNARQAEQKSEFEGFIGQLKERGDQTADDLVSDGEKAKDGFKASAEAALSEIDGIREKVGELYGLITDTSTAGAFHDEAKQQADAADRWRWATVAFGTAAVVIGVAAVALAASIELSPAVIAQRSPRPLRVSPWRPTRLSSHHIIGNGKK